MSATCGRRFRYAERRRKMVELRIGGARLQAIGREMGVSAQRVAKILNEELAELSRQRSESTEELRRLELERLDVMHSAIWPRVEGGDLLAIDRALKISERRCALLGLNLVRHELMVSNEHTVNIIAKIDQYTRELGGAVGAGLAALPSHPEGDRGGEQVAQANPDADASVIPGV
jgi:hypothetical protein